MRYAFLIVWLLGCPNLLAQSIDRQPGAWKDIPLTPGVARVVDVEFDPNDGDRMYAAPDANGIWYTEDRGKHWECITDNIPEVDARISDSEIMVDPDNFDKLYYVGEFGHYYKTDNRGQSWTRVKDDSGEPVFLTDFKRSLVARDKATGEFVMVCTTIGRDHGKNSSWSKGLHVSHDEGVTWKHFPNPSREEEYLEIALHPTNAKVIYAPTTNRLFKSVDGGHSFVSVYEFRGPKGSFSSVATIESRPKWVYLITTNKSGPGGGGNNGPQSALYLSKDEGKTWETIQNSAEGIGQRSSIYGGDVSSWLHCFAINSFNPNEMIVAQNVFTESSDGGKRWRRTSHNLRAQVAMPDGSTQLNKYAWHVADNHVVKFHPKYKSRAYRACDSGLYLRDPENGIDDWLEITGDMQAMLFYSVKVNEFGDRYVIGNTQDVNVESYQYGEWHWVRGYEGDVVFVHPYTNIAYFPNCRCGDANEIKGLFDMRRGGPSITSWGRPQIAANYRNPDESVILYQASRGRGKKAFHTTDRALTAEMLNVPTGSISHFNISRTEEQRFTAVSADAVLTSSDKGRTWKTHTAPANDISFGAVDSDNPNRIWLGSKKGKVFESLDGGKNWNAISDGLPNTSVLKLLYHEGSPRDLYALMAKGDGQFMKPFGIYHLNNTTNEWERWMNGYLLNGFSDMVIDYPSQKMLASSYGRGVWETDLVGVYERFLNGEIEISEINNAAGNRTLTINTPYHLPEYYNYQWRVNGDEKGMNSMLFSSGELKENDVVSCLLSPKYSADIVLKSKKLKLKKVEKVETPEVENVLSSSGHRVDVGYYDYFGSNQDFTIGFKFKPDSDGVVVGNRLYNDHDAKGWTLFVENGFLVLKYSAKYNPAGAYETKGYRTPRLTEQLRFPINPGEWNVVLVSFDRDGKVRAFLDGKPAAEKKMDPSESHVSFNSLFNLHLFADVSGKFPLQGDIDDLKIWNKAATASEIEKDMREHLILHHSFNAHASDAMKERFTGRTIKPK